MNAKKCNINEKMQIKCFAFEVSARLHKVHEKNYILRMHCRRLHKNNTLCIVEIRALNIIIISSRKMPFCCLSIPPRDRKYYNIVIINL
jgi:hypothetical protein